MFEFLIKSFRIVAIHLFIWMGCYLCRRCCCPKRKRESSFIDDWAYTDSADFFSFDDLDVSVSAQSGILSQCVICYDDIKYSDRVMPYSRCHAVCKSCFQQFAMSKFHQMRNAKKIQLSCAVYDCENAYSISDIRESHKKFKALASALQFRRRAMYTAEKSRGRIIMKECPDSDCVGVGLRNRKDFPNRKAKLTFSCVACETKWKSSKQKPITIELVLPKGVKPCPRCGIGIKKGPGCDHMTCIACGEEWSWNKQNLVQPKGVRAKKPPPRGRSGRAIRMYE